jgi:hypothetical protein
LAHEWVVDSGSPLQRTENMGSNSARETPIDKNLREVRNILKQWYAIFRVFSNTVVLVH